MRLSKQRVIVAALFSARVKDARLRLEDLSERLACRGAIVVGTVLQRRGVSRARRPGGAKRMSDPMSKATLIGRGKVEELVQLCQSQVATLVVFYNPITKKQRKNLEDATKVRVIDAPSLDL